MHVCQANTMLEDVYGTWLPIFHTLKAALEHCKKNGINEKLIVIHEGSYIQSAIAVDFRVQIVGAGMQIK